jgi:hypothetical protein
LFILFAIETFVWSIKKEEHDVLQIAVIQLGNSDKKDNVFFDKERNVAMIDRQPRGAIILTTDRQIMYSVIDFL